jgi:hypothetical protein
MRRLVPLLLAALAACQVDVEGAPCVSALDCPAGQGCGLDQRCSARAATCTLDALGARTRDCEQDGLVCGQKSGAPSCECPPNEGPEFAADPAGSRALDQFPYPTGTASPPACRFGRLGDALDAAAARAGANPVVVRAYGDAIFGPVETGETPPLVVPPSLTLEGPSEPAPHAVVRMESEPVGIELQGTLERIKVENVSSTGVAVAVSCGETGKPALRNVAVSGAQLLSAGVTVVGSCGATLEHLEVHQAAGAALRIEAAYDAEVEVLGGRLRESGVGVEVHGGRAKLRGSSIAEAQPLVGVLGDALEIDANLGHGIALVGGETPIGLDVKRALMTNNSGTGLRIDWLPEGSSVSVVASEISGNQASTAGSEYAGGRTAGGVILRQSLPPDFTFEGNTVACNGGSDQVGIYVTGGIDLAPDACGPDSNFFRTKAGSPAVYVHAYATVDASNNYWAPDPPFNVGTGFTLGETCQAEIPPPPCP